MSAVLAPLARSVLKPALLLSPLLLAGCEAPSSSPGLSGLAADTGGKPSAAPARARPASRSDGRGARPAVSRTRERGARRLWRHSSRPRRRSGAAAAVKPTGQAPEQVLSQKRRPVSRQNLRQNKDLSGRSGGLPTPVCFRTRPASPLPPSRPGPHRGRRPPAAPPCGPRTRPCGRDASATGPDGCG